MGNVRHPDPGIYVDMLRQKFKRQELANVDGDIHYSPSIFVGPTNNHVYIFTDEGRLIRPLAHPDLFRQSAAASASTAALIRIGLIRYIDAAEIHTLCLALSPTLLNATHDYVEIHPALILGVTASFIPFVQ
jgi:hypothetical protein